VAARRAPLRRREPPIHLNDGPSVQLRLIGEHGRELAPTRVVDGFGEVGPAEPGHVQGLHAHRLVLTDQPGGELVVEVPPGIGRLHMQAGDPTPSLLPVLRPLLLPAHVPLGAAQRLLPLPKPARVALLPPVRQGHEGRQAKVHAHRRLDDGERYLPRLHDERGVVPSCAVQSDGDRGRFGGQGRDQRTLRSPILGSDRRPSGRSRKRLLLVNRTAWPERRDLKRGLRCSSRTLRP
jgi:hypothetical protein